MQTLNGKNVAVLLGRHTQGGKGKIYKVLEKKRMVFVFFMVF